MGNCRKSVGFGAWSRRALVIAAGAAGLILISSSAGVTGDGGLVLSGMPLSSGNPPPFNDRGQHGEKLTYTYLVTQHGTRILISLNGKPLMTVEKKGDGYALSDPNGSGRPILTLPAPTH